MASKPIIRLRSDRRLRLRYPVGPLVGPLGRPGPLRKEIPPPVLPPIEGRNFGFVKRVSFKRIH